MAGPVIATATVAVELDGRKMLLEARVLGDKVGRALDKRVQAHAKNTGKNAGDGFSSSFLGRLKGSRNDFLNAVGSLFRLIERGAEKGIAGIGSVIGKGISNIGTSLGGLGKPGSLIEDLGLKLSGLGEAVAGMTGKGGWVGIAAGVLIFAAAMWSVFPVVGILGAALSGLTGIAVALVSVLVVGLAAGLLGLAPLLLAVAAGAGAAMIAFSDLSDEQKKMFDPFKEWYDTVKDMVQERVLGQLAESTQGFVDILNTFGTPLLVGAAEALASTIAYLEEALNRPEVQETLSTLSAALPGILSTLGQGLVDFVLGAIGFFTQLTPYASDFAGYIATAAASFAEWANSETGRQQIKDFMEIGVPAFKSLVDLVLELAPALFGLFTEGAGTGQTFIDKITDLVAEFVTWFDQKGGRAEIADWFKQAKKLAEDIGPIIEDLGQLLKDLNSPDTRGALYGLLALIDKLVQAFTWLYDKAEKAWAVIKGFGTGGLIGAANAVRDVLGLKAGGLVTSPTFLAGEAGRELVVPLTRPLSMVDPSVRSLSAIARGMDPSSFNAGYGVSPANGASKVVNIHPGAVQVVAATNNEVQVANAVLDRLVARWK